MSSKKGSRLRFDYSHETPQEFLCLRQNDGRKQVSFCIHKLLGLAWYKGVLKSKQSTDKNEA
jgi:hypothetical protein